jgi:hypothetical protein
MNRERLSEAPVEVRRAELELILELAAGRIGLGPFTEALVRLDWPAQDAVELAELLSTLRPAAAPRMGRERCHR